MFLIVIKSQKIYSFANMFYVINNNNNNKKYVLFDQFFGLLPSKQAVCLFLCQNKLQPGPEFGDSKTSGYTRLI